MTEQKFAVYSNTHLSMVNNFNENENCYTSLYHYLVEERRWEKHEVSGYFDDVVLINFFDNIESAVNHIITFGILMKSIFRKFLEKNNIDTIVKTTHVDINFEQITVVTVGKDRKLRTIKVLPYDQIIEKGNTLDEYAGTLFKIQQINISEYVINKINDIIDSYKDINKIKEDLIKCFIKNY